MQAEARNRLKAAIVEKGYKLKQLSNDLGYHPNYVSRVVSGLIKKPDPKRLFEICEAVDTSISYILTGTKSGPDREQLLRNLADAPDDTISKISEFVAREGLNKS